jgi:hypothetical protein
LNLPWEFTTPTLQKKYNSPEEVLDLAGLRIIGRTLGNVKKIEIVIENNFKIHPPEKDVKQKELEEIRLDIFQHTILHPFLMIISDYVKIGDLLI